MRGGAEGGDVVQDRVTGFARRRVNLSSCKSGPRWRQRYKLKVPLAGLCVSNSCNSSLSFTPRRFFVSFPFCSFVTAQETFFLDSPLLPAYDYSQCFPRERTWSVSLSRLSC